MDEIENIKEIIRNLETNSNDAYFYEVYTEKLIKAVRKDNKETIDAIERGNLTVPEIVYIAEICPQYTTLSGTSDLIDALTSWLVNNPDCDKTCDIKGYVEEARKTYASIFG